MLEENNLKEFLTLSVWVAMNVVGNKETGWNMVKEFPSNLTLDGSYSLGINPLPVKLRNIPVKDDEIGLGVKALLDALKWCNDLISKVIANVEKCFSGPREEWRVSSHQLELVDLYDLALVLDLEIKAQYQKSTYDFLQPM